ncbi:MAG: hypothetical protein ABIU10_10160 [Sphingomicrobium sp.]
MRSGVAKATTILGLVLIAGGSLSACNKKSESEPLLIEPGRESGATDNKFGKEFGSAFNADPNSEPRDVHEGDLAPVSPTTEPVAID